MRIDPRCVVTIVFCVAVLTCPLPSLVWQVTYVTAGILEKNKDPVSEDLVVILKGSDEAAVRQLFTDSPDEAQLMLDRKKGAKFQVRSLPFPSLRTAQDPTTSGCSVHVRVPKRRA